MAIIFTLTGKIELAPYCIFASAIFDFLDGFVARLLKVQNELGKQLDSLADMVTFGVAPGIMVLVMLTSFVAGGDFELPWGDFGKNITLDDSPIPFYLLAFLIPVFALFRLAKFNLDTRQTDSFIGLPTPAMTLYFAVLPLLILSGHNSALEWQYFSATIIVKPVFLIVSSIVMSILMVSEIPLFSFKFKHFKFKGNEIRYIFLTICILLLATLFLWAIPLIIILYIILSLINNAIKPKHEV